MTVAQGLAALPALPLGKGPLILILGGLFALGMSLVWTFLFPREAPMAASAYAYTPRPLQRRQGAGGGSGGAASVWEPVAERQQVEERPDDGWLRELGEATQRMGYGTLQVISSRPHVYRVRLTDCRSCHYRAARTVGCEVERQALECAAEACVGVAEVTEAFCHARREGPCVFEIRTGGRR